MPKKDKEANVPNYSVVTSLSIVDEKIEECQKTIARKYKLRRTSEIAKADITSSYNEQIKMLKEELEHELEVLSGWEDHKRLLSAKGAAEDHEEEEDPKPQAAAPRRASRTSLPIATPTAAPTSSQIPPPPPAPPGTIPMPPNNRGIVPFPVKVA